MKRFAVALALLATLSACTQEDDAVSDPAPVTAVADADPITTACEDVWVVGTTLPADYAGCARDTFHQIPGVCDDGRPYYGVQAPTTEMFARPGDVIVAEDDVNTAAYDSFYEDCYSD